jgi:hypothetical protein
MTLKDALALGRVSNLPTVWSNALVGVVLAGGEPWQALLLPLLVALSLFYIGGMYLNDAFDAALDARERPGRPIPAGRVGVETVFAAGFAMILVGIALVALIAAAALPRQAPAVIAAVALGLTILAYDWHHKGNPWSPVVMGACRLFAYLTAGYALVSAPQLGLFIAALVALAYLIGLTYTAKQESLNEIGSLWPLVFLAAPLVYGLVQLGDAVVLQALLALTAWIGVALWFLRRRAPGDVPRAVVSLIAGIALVDALFLAVAGATGAALAAAVCFALTLALQRWIAGT